MSEQRKTPLELVLDGLREAQAARKKLYMANFFKKDEVRVSSINECGSPACVMGWASLYTPVRDYMTANEIDLTETEEADLNATALMDVLGFEYESNVLWSIADCTESLRTHHYNLCIGEHGFPSSLLQHPHLTKEAPTLDEAIDFIAQIAPHAERVRQEKMEIDNG